jgi:hypothetical protein
MDSSRSQHRFFPDVTSVSLVLNLDKNNYAVALMLNSLVDIRLLAKVLKTLIMINGTVRVIPCFARGLL